LQILAKSFFIQNKNQRKCLAHSLWATVDLQNLNFGVSAGAIEISTYKIHAMMQCSIDKLKLRGQK
jgi:hypothetical protein